ncbi:gamma-butyrobetaine dioxygenase-like [Lytechinus variegatus]|uniref:gamma-butyrobetaine dioxygenase-like n=1 Tax=Lytechinus variegatus TaxID=7654 RepID=UPI001BB21A99|nr:gamma-butyrobetaine dioxygenase-like [Lytechinus variegatus]
MQSARVLASRLLSSKIPLGSPGCLISRQLVCFDPRKTTQILQRQKSTTASRWGQPASSAFDDHAALYADHNWARSIPITDVDKDIDAKMVVVQWEDGDSQRYPNVWLKSNCHCEGCYSKGAHGKLKYTQHLDLDIQADDVTINQDGQMLSIRWSDGHLTNVPSNWLRCNRFDQSDRDPIADAKLDLWGSDVMTSGRLRTFEFDELMQSDKALLDWLSEIKVLGISLVKNAPKISHQIHKLADRVGYVTPSTFGTHSDVMAVQGGDMLGFSNGYLQPHTDFSYYVSPPGVALFHCIKNTSTVGGDSLLIDGFKAAMELKTDHHDDFLMLTKHEVEHVAIAANKKITQQGFYHHARHPLIKLDSLGQLKQITFNEIYHASLFRVPVDDVIPMFSAIKKFNKILLRDDNVFKHKLKEGDILTFNNHRMLHGRSAFTLDTGRVERHLQTCFVEWDCVLSKLRVLKKSV